MSAQRQANEEVLKAVVEHKKKALKSVSKIRNKTLSLIEKLIEEAVDSKEVLDKLQLIKTLNPTNLIATLGNIERELQDDVKMVLQDLKNDELSLEKDIEEYDPEDLKKILEGESIEANFSVED
jgi:hypothetical protein